MFTRQSRAAASLLVALCWVLAPGPASRGAGGLAYAQSSAELAAKQTYTRGAALYHERRFAEAAAAFEEGYRAKSHPAFLWNLALSYRGLGEHAKSIEYYRSYLQACPKDAVADRAAAEAGIAEQERLAAAPPAVADGVGAPALLLGHAGEVPGPGRGSEQKVWRRWWFWTATGAAVAATAVGIGLGVGLAPGSTAPYREVSWR
jgi:tetratricopeptide (TPR) repeat protein